MNGSTLTLAGSGPKIRIGARTIPVVPPRLGDPRLQIAAVILSIHVLGQVALGFSISVPQIAAAIVACALVESGIAFARERRLVWPASAMLTGSGVALIMRDVGTEAGDHWTTRNWWLFAAVAVGALLSKYLIRWRGSHVFNPSNLGLVVAFVLLGSERIEPLDFWWGPLGVGLLVAYWVILAGGVLLTERLGLLEMSVAFWGTFAVAMGALALLGHCFIAPWSTAPVCDGRFWWTIVTSPEILVFLFFMITDPRTVPSGRSARIAFGAAVAMVSSLLIAPQTTEFGAKVGLLAGLVLVCGARPVLTVFAERAPRPRARRPQAIIAGAMLALAGVLLAGLPTRSIGTDVGVEAYPHPSEFVPAVDAARVPTVTADPEVAEFGDDVALRASEIGTELVRALDVEALAAERRNPEILRSVDHGARLTSMTAAIEAASGDPPLTDYHFDRMHLTVVRVGGQAGSRLAIEGVGTATGAVSDTGGAIVSGRTTPFAQTFVLRQGTDGRWLVVDALSNEPERGDG